MSLRPRELAQVVDELSALLVGAHVQKVFAPAPGLCYLELRQRGRTSLLCICTQRDRARISVAQSRLRVSGPALGFQQRLRRELVGTALARISLQGERTAALDFRSAARFHRLVADLGANGGYLILVDGGSRIEAISSERDLSSSGLRHGAEYRPTEHGEREDKEGSSRLSPLAGAAFPLAEAAEALHREDAERQGAEEIRRTLLRSLKKKLGQISRTLEKVRAEATRQPEAEQHRRMGELISQNLHRIKRGERETRLTEYTENGPVDVEVALQTQRSPKQQAEWHFHQYRRLLRGCERAAARLAQLEREAVEVQQQIQQWQSATAEALALQPSRPAPSRRKLPSRSRPYKEYLSSAGLRIWVGRNSRSNDELTFHLARPDDLWLHARAAGGSHVLVRLEKNAEPDSELLVDAAHLALHHSKMKGELRGEVVWARAKYVRRRKGDPPGTVALDREKTLTIRVERDRLERLLRTRTRARDE
jgi:predicted ribosome quality control (RQC) complex YloA/Tae2 family protein